MKKSKITTRISLKESNATGVLMEKLAMNMPGAKKLLSDPEVTVFQISDSTVLEIYGTGAFHTQKKSDKTFAIVNFKVDDIERSVGEMLAAGAKCNDGIVHICKAFAYCHLQLEDGNTIGLYQDK